jgi:hypothetical protein
MNQSDIRNLFFSLFVRRSIITYYSKIPSQAEDSNQRTMILTLPTVIPWTCNDKLM